MRAPRFVSQSYSAGRERYRSSPLLLAWQTNWPVTGVLVTVEVAEVVADDVSDVVADVVVVGDVVIVVVADVVVVAVVVRLLVAVEV